ncbi:MAG TPA: universal stress protein [Solirubrobacteraceae bacterium]|nr:universal stress protein [Solirubrobacteraceae bacterium]
MFANVIVGVDGQEGGRDAIALAQVLRDPGGTVGLAYIHVGYARLYRRGGAAYEASEREHGLELLRRERDEAGLDAELHVRGSASVGRGLHELAEEVGADLLVIGSSRRGILGRVLIGDDTRASLNGAPCPVAIAPAEYRKRPQVVREIGVGYDGSPESQHALEVARGLAERIGAKLSAFEAVSVPLYGLADGVPLIGDAIDEAVAEARDRIADLGIEPHAAYGIAAEELTLYSASVDVLVVGSRGYGPVGRLVHGSISTQLARTARCPLLVLTRAAAGTPSRDTTQDADTATGH